MSSGYRCVNYYELCRLCTASHGTKTHIFSEEGKRKDLIGKIAVCLPVVIDAEDKLPKILCAQCLQQVETIAKFRETCINAQNMLESCLNSSKLRNGGKVYIKDVSAKKPIPIINTSIPAPPLVKTSIIGSTNVTKTQVQNPVVTQSGSSDFLSSIIQAVGIQNVDEPSEQPQQTTTTAVTTPQYTITLDGQTIKTNQIHYKIEPAKPITQDQQQQTAQTFTQTFNSSTLSQVDEFLKLKTNPNISTTIKKKEGANVHGQKKNFDLILSPPAQQQQQQIKTPTTMIQTTSPTTPKTVALQDLKFLSPNKCYVPITIKDAGNDQRQIVAQFDAKNLVLPTAYLQMKIQPQQQLATLDGQHIVQLTAANLPNTISIAPQQQNQIQAQIRQQPSNAQMISSTSSTFTTIPSDTKCIFTTSSGQNVTITHQPLQSISGNIQQQPTQPTIHQFAPPLPPLIPASAPSQANTVDTSMGKIQLTTLQNVSTNNITHPLPQKSGITIQRIKQEGKKLPTTKTITSPTSVAPIVQVVSSTTPTSATKATTATTTTTVRKANNKSTQIQTNANNENNKSGNVNEVVPTCDVCEKVFKRKEHLAQHMKLHLGLRPFKCEETNCNKAFSRKEHLMRHVISHTGKKMFSCEFCHKLFSRKDNLNKHRRTHRQSTNFGSFFCKICNKSFVTKLEYEQHISTHAESVDKSENMTSINSNLRTCNSESLPDSQSDIKEIVHIETIEIKDEEDDVMDKLEHSWNKPVIVNDPLIYQQHIPMQFQPSLHYTSNHMM